MRQLGGDHHRGADTRVDGDRRSDLAEFDAKAADLDLLIGPADELEVTVSVAPRQVTRAVEPATGGVNGSATNRSAVSTGRLW